MTTKKQQFFLFSFFFIFLVFASFTTFSNFLDPDFGWHIKTGQLILERGVPYQDWYSYTMPDFAWIDHEWLMDVIMYKIYSISGIYPLLFIFLFLYTLSYFVIKKPNQDFWTFLIPVIFGYLATFYFLGIRPQLLTVLFIAIIMKIINGFLESSSKLIYLIPALFILWVNLHASFFAGLAILLAILVLEIFKKTKIWEKFKILGFLNSLHFKEQTTKNIITIGIILLASFLATLLNPYGIRIYEEIFRTTGDNFLRFNITEWLPLFFSGFKPFIYFYVAFFIGLLFMYYKKVEFNNIVLSLLFLLLSFTGIRYILVFVIISMPIVIDLFGQLRKDINFSANYKLVNKADKWIFACLFILVFVIFIYGFYSFYSGIIGKEFYPKEAISFLKTLPIEDNLLNDYSWGGYLIWKIPERKYFIDGRMPSWRQDDKFAFGDYVRVIKAKEGFEKDLDKYDIKYALLQKSLKDKYEYSKNDEEGKRIKEFFKKYDRVAYILGISTDNNIYEELKKLGWQEIYEDETSLILKK